MQEVYSMALVRCKDERYDSHCVAIFSSLEKAILCAEKDGHMLSDDGYYQYLVIEKVIMDRPYNIHHSEPRMEPLWYKCNIDKPIARYEKMTDCPKFAKHIVGWGVG